MSTSDEIGTAERRIIYWIAGALGALVMTGGSFWLSYVSAQVDDLRAEQKIDQRESALIRERLKGVETKIESVDATTRATAEDVRRIRESLENARTRSGGWTESNREGR